jgi:hypothetical protein
MNDDTRSDSVARDKCYCMDFLTVLPYKTSYIEHAISRRYVDASTSIGATTY